MISDAELQSMDNFANNSELWDADQQTTELRRYVRTLVAAVRALRVDAEPWDETCGRPYPSDEAKRIKAQVTGGEGFCPDCGSNFERWKAANAPRWTTTPPGPEDDERFFWVRFMVNGKQATVCARYCHDFLDEGPVFHTGWYFTRLRDVIALAGPIAIPE